jgi:hypothetical protein
VEFSVDGRLLYVGLADSRIFVYETSRWTLVRYYDRNTGSGEYGVTAIKATPDGESFLFVRDDTSLVKAHRP